MWSSLVEAARTADQWTKGGTHLEDLIESVWADDDPDSEEFRQRQRDAAHLIEQLGGFEG